MSPLRKKEIPQITWENITPPYKEYSYFQDSEHYPFRYEANAFDAVNAWWLIEAATLVYADQDFVVKHLGKTDLSEVEFFSGPSTQCFVASNADFIMLAFRGTESRRREGRTDFRDIFADLKVDCDIKLVESGQGGRVHQGFKRALDEVWDELSRYIKDIRRGHRKLWITGHSLGAALAALAADRYGDVQGLYTFGSPQVGDVGFKNDFHVNAYRIVNGNDIVTKILPSGLYYHVGELEYIDSNGVLHDNPSHWARWMDVARGGIKNLFKSLGQVRHGFAAFVPTAVRDHVPTLYATHIWNNVF